MSTCDTKILMGEILLERNSQANLIIKWTESFCSRMNKSNFNSIYYVLLIIFGLLLRTIRRHFLRKGRNWKFYYDVMNMKIPEPSASPNMKTVRFDNLFTLETCIVVPCDSYPIIISQFQFNEKSKQKYFPDWKKVQLNNWLKTYTKYFPPNFLTNKPFSENFIDSFLEQKSGWKENKFSQSLTWLQSK